VSDWNDPFPDPESTGDDSAGEPAEDEAPSPPIPQQDEVAASPPEDRCSIIGPTKAGKTFLLGAMHQACHLSGADGYRLTFVPRVGNKPENEGTSDLLRRVVERIIDNDPTALPATEVVRNYVFQVSCRTSPLREPVWLAKDAARWVRARFSGNGALDGFTRRPGANNDITFDLLDSPGGMQFPERAIRRGEYEWPYWSALVKHLRDASRLVICVDALKPELKAFAAGFPALVAAATMPVGRLGARRLLLLLTKVDALVEDFLVAARGFSATKSGTNASTHAVEILTREFMTPR